MVNVSKNEFQKFLKVRNEGRINMTDIVTGSVLAGISEDTYEKILFNFPELAKVYGTKLPSEPLKKELAKSTESNEITRLSKYKTYKIEFYNFKDRKLNKCIGETTATGLENIYDVVKLAAKTCRNRIPHAVHLTEVETNKELWQSIGLVPCSRIKDIEYYK